MLAWLDVSEACVSSPSCHQLLSRRGPQTSYCPQELQWMLWQAYLRTCPCLQRIIGTRLQRLARQLEILCRRETRSPNQVRSESQLLIIFQGIVVNCSRNLGCWTNSHGTLKIWTIREAIHNVLLSIPPRDDQVPPKPRLATDLKRHEPPALGNS